MHKCCDRLKLPKNLRQLHPVFHHSLLKKSPDPDCWHPRCPPPPPLWRQGQLHYEISEILDSKVSRGRLFYLVHWAHFGVGEDEWVKASDLLAPKLVTAFHRLHPTRPGVQSP